MKISYLKNGTSSLFILLPNFSENTVFQGLCVIQELVTYLI